MKSAVLGSYIALEVGVVILAVVSYFVWDKRYRKNHGQGIPQGFERTEEVSIDPVTGMRVRVYYNSRTGERYYHEQEED